MIGDLSVLGYAIHKNTSKQYFHRHITVHVNNPKKTTINHKAFKEYVRFNN